MFDYLPFIKITNSIIFLLERLLKARGHLEPCRPCGKSCWTGPRNPPRQEHSCVRDVIPAIFFVQVVYSPTGFNIYFNFNTLCTDFHLARQHKNPLICCWMKKTSTHYVSICFTMSAELRPLQICSAVASVFSTGSSHGPGAANSIDSSWHSKGSNARGDAAEEWLWTPSTARNLVTGCFRNSLPKKFKESMNLVRITRDLSWFTVLEIIFLGFNFFLTHPSSSAISTFDQGPKRPEDTKPAQEAQGLWSPEGHEERTRRNQHLWVKSAEEWVAPGIPD